MSDGANGGGRVFPAATGIEIFELTNTFRVRYDAGC